MQLCLGPWVVQKLGMQQWTRRHGDPYLLELHLSGRTDRGQVSGLSLPGLRDPRARLLTEQSPSWEEDVGGVWMHLQEEVTLKLRPWAWVREGQKWKSALGRRNSYRVPVVVFISLSSLLPHPWENSRIPRSESDMYSIIPLSFILKTDIKTQLWILHGYIYRYINLAFWIAQKETHKICECLLLRKAGEWGCTWGQRKLFYLKYLFTLLKETLKNVSNNQFWLVDIQVYITLCIFQYFFILLTKKNQGYGL